MIRLGLVGYPLEHSLSPALHQAALQAASLQGEYKLHPVRPGDVAALRHLVNRIRAGDITGLNVTIPHKQAIVPLLDELTPAAKAIGAVNTIYLKDGKTVGDNTDFAGFLADLLRWMPIPRTALVLGAGGAARAVTYALETMGCQVRVAARRARAASELCGHFANATAIELYAETLQGANADLLVNGTSAGMYPDIGTCAWPEGLRLPPAGGVHDLVYNPPETRLLKLARAEGLRATNGLGMLIEQASLSFDLWTGYRPSRDCLMDAIGQVTG